MSTGSRIEWTDTTWGPTTGCDRTSPGCDHCYALTLAKRLKAMGQARYQNDGDPRTSGPGFGLTCHPDSLDAPLHWRKPRRVFVNSMSDLFHDEVPSDFLCEVFARMGLAQQHTFQVLTKRSQRMRGWCAAPGLFPEAWFRAREERALKPDIQRRFNEGTISSALRWPLPNVWLGTSIENDRYTFRANHLRETPAAVRFLSCEPLLGPLPSLDLTCIDWVIIGGESGHGARPMELAWAEDVVARCQAAGVAVFVKQLGSSSGRDHHDIETFPESLRVREYPQ